jgi:hypothetical protein
MSKSSKKPKPKLSDLKKATLAHRLFNDKLEHMRASEPERKKNVRINVVETQAIAARFKKSPPTDAATNIITAKEIIKGLFNVEAKNRSKR